jgi:glycerol-3-phosphate cytidylyltransferase-like family protein
MDIDRLLLETKSDIFITSIEEFIHQPTIQEISYTMQGEHKFFEVLNNISKTIIDIDLLKKQNTLTSEQIEVFKKINSFDYFIGLITKDISLFIYLKLLLKLFFPNHICTLQNLTEKETNQVIIFLEMQPKEQAIHKKKFIINQKNYEEIIEYIKSISCLKLQDNEEEEFNPINEKARQIAEKIKENRKKIQEIKSKENSGYYLAKMINLLRGTGKFSSQELNNMTIYELIQTFKRNNLYEAKEEQVLYHVNGFEVKEFID